MYAKCSIRLLPRCMHCVRETRSSHEKAVHLSVCPSVCQTRALWQNESKFCPDFFTTRKNFYPSFACTKNRWWGLPSTWNFGSNWPSGAKTPFLKSIFSRSASAVTHSEKRSVDTNMKSTTHFPMSLIRWTSYVAPKHAPKLAQKRKTAVFHLKSHFAWRKSATKFLCVKTVSDKVVRHSRAKMICGDVPFYVKIWRILTHPLQNADFQSIFARSATAVTSGKKSSINTTRKSTIALSNEPKMNQLTLSPKGGSETQGIQNLNNNLR